MHGWLGGGAENGRGVVMIGKFLNDAEARFEEIDREGLGLIQNDK
jgi:hypothetical protein